MRGKSDSKILYYSNKFFLSQGYEDVTVRQIAKAADVSIGLLSYHFGSKRQIAVSVMERYLRFLKQHLSNYIIAKNQPLEHASAMVKLSIDFFLKEPRKQFYLECLKDDIYMEAIQTLGNNAMKYIAETHNLSVSEDMLLLFDNYIPPSVEKILILEKEKGNFSKILYEDIAEIVFAVSVDRYLENSSVLQASKEGCLIARKALSEIPLDIIETLFAITDEQYVERNIYIDN